MKRKILTSSHLSLTAENYHEGTYHGFFLENETPGCVQNALQYPEKRNIQYVSAKLDKSCKHIARRSPPPC